MTQSSYMGFVAAGKIRYDGGSKFTAFTGDQGQAVTLTFPGSSLSREQSITVDFGAGDQSAVYQGCYFDGNTEFPLILMANYYYLLGQSQARTYEISQSTFSPSLDAVAPIFTPRKSACWSTDMLIHTARGDVAVEALQVGDIAISRDCQRKQIRWISRHEVHCDRHPGPRVTSPVRDFVDDAHVAHLEEDALTCWHVKFDGYDILLANGLPAESYIDIRGHASIGGDTVVDSHSDDKPATNPEGKNFCLPLIPPGPLLTAIRARHGTENFARTGAASIQTDVYLAADDTVLEPNLVTPNELRFLVPSDTRELRLVSPRHTATGGDVRRLGVIISGLAMSDGSGWHSVALDDPSLYAGFHDIEREGEREWRWTDGEAYLSPALWSELSGVVLVKIEGTFSVLRIAEAADEVVDVAV